MKQIRQEQGYTDAHIAELSGIPVETVQKIFEGQTKGIEYHIWKAVEDVFIDKMMVREGAVAYGTCTPFISPVDVQPDNDERTMIQPDVVIVCNPDQIVRRNILGAPDFVLEVISPGTGRRDYVIKLAKYEQAGVKEYWVVDPYKKRVLVYYLKGEVFPVIYPIDAGIPVNIFGGKLVLKFDRIAEWAKEA